jgi:predicted TIM-barrel fold metal-dependent hydrolase
VTYALDTLKLDGVATTTSTDDLYLGDPRYNPWLEEMNRRGVTLFVHPVPAKASRSVDLGIDASILEFMFDTTRMLINMVFSGAKKRFSKIKIISTHGGGTIPYLMTRIETLEKVFGPGKGHLRLSPPRSEKVWPLSTMTLPRQHLPCSSSLYSRWCRPRTS